MKNLSDEELDSNLNSSYYLNALEWLDETFSRDILENKTLRNIKSYIENPYLTPFSDWTSYMSNALASLYDQLSTWVIAWKDKAKKFHQTWIINWERYLWKTLFNRADIKIYDNNQMTFVPKDNVSIIWEESLKLKWGYTKYSSPKKIKIDWQTFEVLWEVKWTKLSDFKDATSDSIKQKDEQTFTEQIINSLHYSLKDEYLDIVKTDLDKLYVKYFSDIWLDRDDLKSYWRYKSVYKKLK